MGIQEPGWISPRGCVLVEKHDLSRPSVKMYGTGRGVHSALWGQLAPEATGPPRSKRRKSGREPVSEWDMLSLPGVGGSRASRSRG